MVRLTPRQRDVMVEKMPDVANVIAGSMFFGQFLTERPFSLVLAILGMILCVLLWVFTLFLARGEAR